MWVPAARAHQWHHLHQRLEQDSAPEAALQLGTAADAEPVPVLAGAGGGESVLVEDGRR